MTNLLSKAVRCLHTWGCFTDTRRKKALWQWQEDTKALIAKLETEMDPLIARLAYNSRYCTALYRLPDQVFLRIMEFLSQDEASFFILRQVSRRFRLLLKSPQFSGHRFFPSDGYDLPNAENQGIIFFDQSFDSCLPSPPLLVENEEEAALRVEIALLLHIDTYCIRCLKRDRPEHRGNPRNGQGFCNFYCSLIGPYYCRMCRVSHPWRMFPKREGGKLMSQDTTACHGTMGYVRLCEHEVITWNQMRSFISQCQAKAAPHIDPDSVVEMVVRTCYHKSHGHTKCTLNSPGTNNPTARLFYKRTHQWRLELTWAPHSGPGAFSSYQPGKFDAAEMRGLFRRYRRSAAQFIVPETVPNVLPEMTCFRLNECNCLNYGNESEVQDLLFGGTKMQICDSLDKNHVPLDTVTQHCHHQQPYQASQHVHTRVEICQQTRQKDTIESPCIVTIYKRLIEGMSSCQGLQAIPSHDWLHAMDRSSYRRTMTGGIQETCKDPSCRNTYPISVYGCYEKNLNIGYNLLPHDYSQTPLKQTKSKASKDKDGFVFEYVTRDNPTGALAKL